MDMDMDQDEFAIASWHTSPSLPIPLDILLHVLHYLPIQNIFALRQTNKSFRAVTHLRSLWSLLLQTHVQEQHIPTPDLNGRSLHTLSASELELLVCDALALRSNWSNPNPHAKREIDFYKPTDPDSRIIFIEFLPGRGNRWLISVTMTHQPRKFVIQCWDVAVPQPECVAELTHIDGPYGGVVINDDPSSPAILAMQSAQTEILTIDFEEQDPESAFVPLNAIDGIREIHLLNGSTLVTQRPAEDGGEVILWDLADLRQEKLLLVNSSLSENARCQAMHLRDDYIVIVRQQTIEIYSIVPRQNIISLPGAPPVAYPLAQHHFQWRIDTVNIAEQLSSHHPCPINIVIRFGSMYSWPVNILHHFVLAPNTAYLPARETCQYNLPYLAQPAPVQTIGSPVRLFGPAAVALGKYGTAIWLDSHAEDWLGPSNRAQRLAGKLVRVAGDNSSSLCWQDNLKDSMVFHVQEDDMWNRIAIDEESGRIAVGYVNGSITLFEYA